MNRKLVKSLLTELRRMPILDPHTHVPPASPTARCLGDLLGYHYYTELSNSSRGKPEKLPADPAARVDYVWPHLPELRGTVQFDWMAGLGEFFLGLKRAEWKTAAKEEILARAQQALEAPDYTEKVFAASNIKRLYLTNQFDEDLEAVKDDRFVPCMRTDDLVEYFDTNDAPARLKKAFGVEAGKDLASLREALTCLFDRFAARKMGYAAVGLPSSFQADKVPDEEAAALLRKTASGAGFSPEEKRRWAAFAVEELAAQCGRVGAPFCLMTGADRLVYAQGVPSGQDQLRSSADLRGYDRLFNEHPDVRFPVLIMTDATALELDAAGWIRHNVYPMSHWWYANNPGDIRRGLRRRLEVLPRNKFIGFHSDAYSTEFILPKFNVFRVQLALVLAEKIEESEIAGPEISEPLDFDGALALAEKIMLRNPEEIFGIKK